LYPPHVHRRNAAERAIRTFKNHFVAGVSSVDPNFPLKLWDRLLPQAIRTLNMLRPTRINQNISADAYLNGQHDFNKHPMAPPGTKTVAHLKPQQRTSWSKHGIMGWYVGPSFNHYRCYRIYIPKTRGERIVDTVELFSTHSTTPTWSANQEILLAATKLTTALQHPNADISHLNEHKLQALKHLAQIFNPAMQQKQNSPHIIPEMKKVPAIVQSPPRVPTMGLIPTTEHTLPRVQNPSRYPGPEPQPNHLHVIPNDDPDNDPDVPNPMQTHRYMTRSKSADTANHINFKEIKANSDHIVNAIIDPDTGKSLEYRHLMANPKTRKIWERSCSNEFGRLCQGVADRVKGTDTLHFIPRSQVPKNKTVTYPRIVCDYRPTKSEPNRTRITVGGNLIIYTDEVYTATAGLMTAKILINSVLSTPNAKCALFDIKDFYLNSFLKQKEYMRFKYTDIPDEIKQQYQLHTLVHSDGYVYTEICRGMYGLPQAGIVANTDLKKHLAPHGYHPVPHTPGLWKHETKNILFALVVDDFAIKYTNIEDLHHLQKALQQRYTITIDLEANLYCGVHLKWDYNKRTCQLSMPGYINKLLHKMQHPLPTQPVHSPYKWSPPQYGSTIQTPVQDPQGVPVTAEQKRKIQSIIGSLLYYARAVDPTLLPAINTIAMQQSIATEETMQAAHKLLDFVATYPNAAIIYNSSDMILHVHSDASFLSAPKARSRTAGYFHLTKRNHEEQPFFNAPIHVDSKVLRHVMSSAAEAELGALFHNCKIAEVIRTTLKEMGHQQPPTTVVTDNSTACGIANNNMKLKQSKTMDLRFFWVKDRVLQNHFRILWQRGNLNRADYFTKHHSAAHHKRTRPFYIHDSHNVSNSLLRSDMRGCVNPLTTYVQEALKGTRVTCRTEEFQMTSSASEPIIVPHTRDNMSNKVHTNYYPLQANIATNKLHIIY